MAEDWFPGPGDWTVIRHRNGGWRVQHKGVDVGGCVAVEVRGEPGLTTLRLEFIAHEFTIRESNPQQD
jgi:hypothetical protein